MKEIVTSKLRNTRSNLNSLEVTSAVSNRLNEDFINNVVVKVIKVLNKRKKHRRYALFSFYHLLSETTIEQLGTKNSKNTLC